MEVPSFDLGVPREIVFTANQDGAMQVLWQISFNQPQVVPVGEDGKARFTYTPAGSFQLTVSSRTPGGVESGGVQRTYTVPGG